MLEPEIAYADATEAMNVAESLVRHGVCATVATHPEEVAVALALADREGVLGGEDLAKCLERPFGRVTFKEAKRLLAETPSAPKFDPSVPSLRLEEEKYLADNVFQGPVFVTDFPAVGKPFYCRRNNDRDDTVACFDLLLPRLGEVVGGAQREERSDVLDAAVESQGGEKLANSLHWYRQLRYYGAMSAGFGLGFDRLLMAIVGASNVRDVVAFPRSPGNCLM
mmetsp:Transcript_19727/g.47100  ORF Transcript_19727/g.47100 Transcript_19727/m.47100 type:complete len:223 (-) Transcript_19727:84-752(-)